MKKILMFLFIVFVATSLRQKASAQVYSLNEILDSITLKNPGLQQFSLKSRSDIALSTADKAWEAPEIGLGVNEFPYNTTNEMNGMPPRKMPMIRFSQMFPNASAQRAESAFHQSLAVQNEDEFKIMENMLFTKAKTAYYQSLIAQRKLSVTREQLAQLRLLINTAEGSVAYGKADLPSIYEAKSHIGDLQVVKIQLEDIVNQSAITMNLLMNLPADVPLRLDTTVSMTLSEPDILQSDSSYILTHRSDIQLLDHEMESMDRQKKMISTQNKPTFGITWDNMRMSDNTYMYNVMAIMSIPLAPWSSGKYRAKREALDYQIAAIQKDKEGRLLDAVSDINTGWLRLSALRKSLSVFKNEIIPAYQKTYNANLNALSENTGDIYKTLMSWNDLTMKKMEYLDKLQELLLSKVDLESKMQIK